MTERQRPLKTAIVGCGGIAWQHLPYVANSPRCRLVAVCDHSRALAKHAQQQFGADGYFVDHHDMLKSVDPDVVHVLTPPHTHVAICQDALNAGAHVICEKPMTGSAQETRQLLATARSRGRVLVESRNYLFNDPVLALDGMVGHDRLGRIVECDLLLSLEFLTGPLGDPNLTAPAVRLHGGAILDLLPHLAYLYLHFTQGRDVQDLRGYLQNISGNARVGFDHLDVLVRSDGARGRLRIASDIHPDSFRLILRGTGGTIETDLYLPAFRYEGAPNVGKRAFLGQVANARSFLSAGARNFREKVMGHSAYHGLPRMLDAIYRSLQEETDLPISENEMIKTAELVERLLALEGVR